MQDRSNIQYNRFSAMRTRRALGAAMWLRIVITILGPGCVDACRADGVCVSSSALAMAVNNYPDSEIGAWDTSAVTNMSGLFRNDRRFNGNVSGWNTASVTSMDRMFEGAMAFNGAVSGWNKGRVTSMVRMFYNARAFDGNVSG